MKITAGLGSLDACLSLAKAGADAFFFGYVPSGWYLRYGADHPLNRREVLCSPVQIGSRSELRILRRQLDALGADAAVTLNCPSYPAAQLPDVLRVMEDCMADGFRSFILADPALLLAADRAGLAASAHIHISGETGLWNASAIRRMTVPGVTRIIFPRQLPLRDMAACIRKTADLGLEYEAFALNEQCHFQGGWCATLHCDALPPMCRVPYRIVHEDGSPVPLPEAPPEQETVGSGGCALCALRQLQAIGITHLKLVGRGGLLPDMLRDAACLRKALRLLKKADDEANWLRLLRQEIFPDGCSGDCYYPDETGKICL